MRQPAEKEVKQNDILDKCFECLVRSGLEGTTTRLLCESSGLTNSSLYYWFSNKDEIVLDATSFGIRKVADDLFTQAFNSIDSLKLFFEIFPNEALSHKDEIRFIYQVATSPRYGAALRQSVGFFPKVLDRYVFALSGKIGCRFEDLQPVIYQFAATLMNHLIWEEKVTASKQFDAIYKEIMKLVD